MAACVTWNGRLPYELYVVLVSGVGTASNVREPEPAASGWKVRLRMLVVGNVNGFGVTLPADGFE